MPHYIFPGVNHKSNNSFKPKRKSAQSINLNVRHHGGNGAMHDTKSLFGIDAAQFIEIVDQLALAKGKTNYSFMAADDYECDNVIFSSSVALVTSTRLSDLNSFEDTPRILEILCD